DTVALLERASLAASGIADGMPDLETADVAYENAFKAYGLDIEALEPEEAARRVRDSAIASQLLTALEDWGRIKGRLHAGGGRPVWGGGRVAGRNPRRRRGFPPGAAGRRGRGPA